MLMIGWLDGLTHSFCRRTEQVPDFLSKDWRVNKNQAAKLVQQLHSQNHLLVLSVEPHRISICGIAFKWRIFVLHYISLLP